MYKWHIGLLPQHLYSPVLVGLMRHIHPQQFLHSGSFLGFFILQFQQSADFNLLLDVTPNCLSMCAMWEIMFPGHPAARILCN